MGRASDLTRSDLKPDHTLGRELQRLQWHDEECPLGQRQVPTLPIRSHRARPPPSTVPIARSLSMPTLPSKPLIFISHRVSDADVAAELQRILDEEFLGLPAFFNASDEHSLEPGTAWFESIVAALRGCNVLLAVLSSAALSSPWVHFESGAAWLRDVLVIPCCIGQVRKGALPEPYNRLQAVDLDDSNDLDHLIARLARETGLRFTAKDRTSDAERFARIWQATVAASAQAISNDAGSRIDILLAITWQFRESRTVPDCWAATYTQECEIQAVADQLEEVLIELAPSVQSTTFEGANEPSAHILAKERSSLGDIRLAPPRASGGRFVARLYFDPPLRRMETASFKVQVDFPAYKTGSRERLVELLLDADAPMRDYEFTQRKVLRPCHRLIYQLLLPKRFGSIPLTPQVLLDGNRFEEEERYVSTEPGVYTVEEKEIGGDLFWNARLDRVRPPQYLSYRMRWLLPRRRNTSA